MRGIRGITLVALVITIIILLILAGITIVSLKNNGIIDKTYKAKEEYKNAQIIEEQYLNTLETEIDKESGVTVVGTKVEGIKILDKEYIFTCIDTNYHGYYLYLCDEVIPYSICGRQDTYIYENSRLRTWLNENAPENAIEINLEDTNTRDRMFMLSKEENEKYEEYTAIPWEGSTSGGNSGYWTRTYASGVGGTCFYQRSYDGRMIYTDIYWSEWIGVRPAYILEK